MHFPRLHHPLSLPCYTPLSEGAPSAALIVSESRRSVLVTLRVALAPCVLSRLEIRTRKFKACSIIALVRGFICDL